MIPKSSGFRKASVGDRVLCYGKTEGVVLEVYREKLLVELEKEDHTFEEEVRKEETKVI